MVQLLKENVPSLNKEKLTSKILRQKIFCKLFKIDIHEIHKFYRETNNLIENFLDVAKNKKFSLLISLAFFTKYENFNELYALLNDLFQMLRLSFGNDSEFKGKFDFNYFKLILIDYYKICASWTMEVFSLNKIEEFRNHKDFIQISLSEYMIEKVLIGEMDLDSKINNFKDFFTNNKGYLDNKAIRYKLYNLREEIENSSKFRNHKNI